MQLQQPHATVPSSSKLPHCLDPRVILMQLAVPIAFESFSLRMVGLRCVPLHGTLSSDVS